jgi:hypothetical protein
MNQTTVKTPTHLWVIGLLALLWNAMGAFDYLATQLQLEFYMAKFTPEQLDYFYGLPTWVVAAWAIAVWSSLLGTIALLLRKSWAVTLFGIAIAGLLITTVHNFVLSNGAEMMGSQGVIFSVIIWVIALLLFFYARAMESRRILR